MRRVLEGGPGARAGHRASLNAGASLFIAGVVDSVADGIAAAARTLDEGAALKRLEMMVNASQAAEQQGHAGGRA